MQRVLLPTHPPSPSPDQASNARTSAPDKLSELRRLPRQPTPLLPSRSETSSPASRNPSPGSSYYSEEESPISRSLSCHEALAPAPAAPPTPPKAPLENAEDPTPAGENHPNRSSSYYAVVPVATKLPERSPASPQPQKLQDPSEERLTVV